MSKDASGNPADPSNNTSAQSNQDQETGSGERTPRPSTRREISDVSSRQTEPSPRFQLPRPLHDTSTNEASRLISRDFADQEPLRQLRSVRSVASSRFRQPSIRRRLDSTHPSPSPGPSLPWRQFIDSDRRSVAIASGREDDLASHRTFSLAGPPTIDSLLANQTYVDPGYVQLNPAYDQPSNTRPVWGLAKPLPHVLRPGMVPTKEELKKEVLRAEDEPDSAADLEEGRIEPSLRPGRIAAQLDDVRRDREIGLFEAFQQHGIGSPGLSPFARHSKEPSTQHNVPPDIRSPLAHPIYEEDEEQTHRPSDPELHGLTEAVSQTNRLKEEREELKLPYQDVIPLTAYEAENDEIHNLHTYWSVVRLRFREPLAELLGVSISQPLLFPANEIDHCSIHPRFQCQSCTYRFTRNSRCRRHRHVCLGICYHDRYLHRWWHFWRASESGHLDYALHLSRLPTRQTAIVLHSSDCWRIPRNADYIHYVSARTDSASCSLLDSTRPATPDHSQAFTTTCRSPCKFSYISTPNLG